MCLRCLQNKGFKPLDYIYSIEYRRINKKELSQSHKGFTGLFARK